MSDVTFVRFVDEHRAHVRWLLAQDALAAASALEQKALLNAAASAMEMALIGYFAERTQVRFQAQLWQDLLAVGLHYRRLLTQAPCAEYLIAFWLNQEAELDSDLAVVQAAIGQAKTPAPVSYRTGLLSATSLLADSTMIATSAAPERVTLASLQQAWTLLDSQIDAERAQAHEC